jgi:UDP-glucose 4-epimerase
LKVVKEISGVDFPIIEVERFPGDPASLVARSERFRRELQWEPWLADQPKMPGGGRASWRAAGEAKKVISEERST